MSTIVHWNDFERILPSNDEVRFTRLAEFKKQLRRAYPKAYIEVWNRSLKFNWRNSCETHRFNISVRALWINSNFEGRYLVKVGMRPLITDTISYDTLVECFLDDLTDVVEFVKQKYNADL